MEEIMIGREMNPKEMIPEEENQEGAKIFGKLAGASLLYENGSYLLLEN